MELDHFRDQAVLVVRAARDTAPELRGLDYILGAREQRTMAVREVASRDAKPFAPLPIERARGETQLFVKEVTADGARYIVCRNEAEAEKDRANMQAVVEGHRSASPAPCSTAANSGLSGWYATMIEDHPAYAAKDMAHGVVRAETTYPAAIETYAVFTGRILPKGV